MSRQDKITSAKKLRQKMQASPFPAERAALLKKYDQYAPDNAASLYRKGYGKNAKITFFARPTTDAEKELYGTPFVYRFNERPYIKGSTDGMVTRVGFGGKG